MVLVVASKLIDDEDVDVDTVDFWYIPFELSSKAINLVGSFNWWRIPIAWGRLKYRFSDLLEIIKRNKTFEKVLNTKIFLLNNFDMYDQMNFDSIKNFYKRKKKSWQKKNNQKFCKTNDNASSILAITAIHPWYCACCSRINLSQFPTNFCAYLLKF